MWKKLFARTALFSGKKKLVRCWVIKQVDPGMLHLCALGTPVSPLKRPQLLEQLQQGRFEGGIQMGDTGIVLHSQLFAELIPEAELEMLDVSRARWQDQEWVIAKVPQRCWAWQGRLVAHPNTSDDGHRWISSEDVSELRRKAADGARVKEGAPFQLESDLEPPGKDVEEAVRKAQEDRQRWAKEAWGWQDKD
ncbi:hypothetical protein [Halomonas sp. Y3]|uniref:hypothetical protein n=1 Tax=Halomonas sp. Y3 TaxID=2956797 RepID=UPI00209E8C91|nr:hypothetical protein [Halomonas sp. Y3]